MTKYVLVFRKYSRSLKHKQGKKGLRMVGLYLLREIYLIGMILFPILGTEEMLQW